MAAFKLTMSSSSSSSSSSICGKSHLIVDKWMRSRISSSSSSSSSSSRSNNTRLSTKRVVRIRVLMGMNKLTAINGEQMEVGWRGNGWRLISCAHEHFGNAHSKGLLVKRNWRRCFSSETKASISEMTSSNENKEEKKKKMEEEKKDLLLQQQDEEEEEEEEEEEQSSKLLTLPTILTLGRVAAVPLLVSTFYMTSWWATTVTTGIFIAAAITDWLDGYLARKMRLGTAFGAFLDPVADKLMVAATLVLLCTRPSEVAVFGEIPWLLPVPAIAIIGREITMSAVREWAASQDGKVLEAVAVNNLGKWKTATQMTALTILLATRDSSLAGPGVFAASGVALLYVSAGLAVWSLAVYMKNIWRVLLK